MHAWTLSLFFTFIIALLHLLWGLRGEARFTKTETGGQTELRLLISITRKGVTGANSNKGQFMFVTIIAKYTGLCAP